MATKNKEPLVQVNFMMLCSLSTKDNHRTNGS